MVVDILKLLEFNRKEIVGQKKLWAKAYDDINNHLTGLKPSLIETRRPNELPEIQAYRTKIFRPITKASINKGITNMYRIAQGTSWHFRVSEELGDFVKNTKIDGKKNFKQWFDSVLLRKMIVDPNALLFILPIIDEAQNLIDIKIEVIPHYDIYALYDNAVSFTYNGKDWVNFENYLLSKSSAQGDWEIVYNYFHDGMLVFPLGGTPAFAKSNKTNSTEIKYYESFFQPYVPFADEALCLFSDHQAVNLRFSHPMMEETERDCEYNGCNGNGYYYESVEEEESEGAKNRTTCSMCKGTGKLIYRSPYGTYVKPQNDGFGEEVVQGDSIKIHNADPSILKYSAEEWQKNLEMAEDAIHVVRLFETNSGEAKKQDKEGQFAFLTQIANNFYDNLIVESLRHMEFMLNGDNAVLPVIHKPTSFEIKTEQMSLQELKTIGEAQVPRNIRNAYVNELVNRKFMPDDSTRRINEVMSIFDPFRGLEKVDKDGMLALRAISLKEYLKGEYGEYLMRLIFNRDPKLIYLPSNDILAVLNKEYEAYYNTLPTQNEFTQRLDFQEETDN